MNKECWTEIDLYWFQGEEINIKVKELFDRLTPLWSRESNSRKGLSLCIGWLYDSVLYWNKKMDDVIATCQAPTYESWTYDRIRQLNLTIKQEAVNRGILDFHVAFDAEKSCAGWSGRTDEIKERPQYNIEGRWFIEHPEINFERYGIFYFGSKVRIPDDEAVCSVIEPTFGEYFADKLCDMCTNTEFDAVVLRDFIFTRPYTRGGRNRYMEPEYSSDLNMTFINLFTRIKSQIPDFIIIGYDSGTSSMEEWRSHGFDLEQVAMSGYLDLWITQTWASAWQDYWPAHSLGYTFQLSSVLVNLAMLEKTKCNHMFLIELFDAWEPWDSIHQYPSKVAWEIWAYSHAALIKPDGILSRSSGCYISWLNRASELIPEKTVEYLYTTMNECAADLKKNPIPGGPCLIYHREGLENLINNPENFSRGEEMDDWTSMLHKYGVPTLSITRSEWIGKVESDGFIFPAPSNINDALADILFEKLKSNIPILFTGQANLISEKLKNYLSIETEKNPITCTLPSAASVSENLGNAIRTFGLQVNQRQRTLKENGSWEWLINCLGGPVLAKYRGDIPCLIWETPEWGTPNELHLTTKSIGSPQGFYAVSNSFNQFGWGLEGIRWINDDWQKPVCFLFWRYDNKDIAFLLGNLETGVTGNSQFAVRGTLSIEDIEKYTIKTRQSFNPGLINSGDSAFKIALAPHKACVFTIENFEYKELI